MSCHEKKGVERVNVSHSAHCYPLDENLIVISYPNHKLRIKSDGKVIVGDSLVLVDTNFTNTMRFLFDSLVVFKYEGYIPYDSVKYFRHKERTWNELKARWDSLQMRYRAFDYEYADIKKEIEL